MNFDTETLAFGEVAKGVIVQVCPKMINVLSLATESETSKRLALHSAEERSCTIVQSCIDTKTNTVFCLVRQAKINDCSDSQTAIEAF